MSATTGISWTDSTWNPVRGCSRVSQGCTHCYAETVAARFSKPGQPYDGLTDEHGRWNGRTMVIDKHLADPIRWREPRKIFVNSMSDLFHESISDEVIDKIFVVMAFARRHTFQVLTKRPERMREYAPTPDRWDAARHWLRSLLPKKSLGAWEYVGVMMADQPWPLPNVWLGVSAEDQETWDDRVEQLGRTPAAVRFVSAEPLLGPIDCGNAFDLPVSGSDYQPIDWVIVGGESGPGHRPMDPEWAESIVRQCDLAHVAVFVKQDSGAKPGHQGRLSADIWAAKEFPIVGAPPLPSGGDSYLETDGARQR